MTQRRAVANQTMHSVQITQNDLTRMLGYNLKRAYMALHTDFRATVEQFGLTQRTFSLLSIVCENPDASQSDVSRSLGIERSGAVVIVDELERRGLIRRAPVPGDRRAHALRATQDGQDIYDRALGAVIQHEASMLGDFSETEIDKLRGLLARIHNV